MTRLLENSIPPAAPFDAIARIYDRVFSNSAIGRAQRKAVWDEMGRVFQPGQRILEINCGTGIDAVHLALRGIQVDACDSSPEMIAQARQRIESLPGLPIRFLCLPAEEIDELDTDELYDGALSNFSGLNCVPDLRSLTRSLSSRVRPGGTVIVCVFGKFCLWEVLWYLCAGNITKAFRRLRRHGVKADLAPGVSVIVHYWSIRYLKEMLTPWFRLERRRGIGVVSPPTYAASLVARFPHLFRVAAKVDPLLGWCPGIRAIADHVVLTFQRSGHEAL